MTTLLEARTLTVTRGDRLALDAVDVTVSAGTTTAVIGANGSGKSTLLHAVVGLVALAGGTVRCDRASTALVLQSTEVDPAVPLTVRDTVRMARYPRRGLLGRFRAEDHAAVELALARMEITDLSDRQLHDLSGGQRQRVLVAQGLAQEADLLLLDEPVTGLDLSSRGLVTDAIDQERETGRAVVVTTHNLEDARRADQVVLLATRAVAVGTPAEVLRHDHLHEAFGGRVIQLPDGELLMDDPHHEH